MAFDPTKKFEKLDDEEQFDPTQSFEALDKIVQEGARPETPTFDAPFVGEGKIISQQEQPSQLQAGALGLAEGATLGFAGELAGAARAGVAKISGEEKDLMDLYRKYRDLSEKTIEESREAHPGTFLAGEAGSALIPGLGAMGLVAKGAKGLSTGAKLARGAGTGAAIGGTAALGTGQADITKGEILPAVQEFGVGAALGGTVGATIPAVGGVVSAIKKPISAAVKDTEFLSDIARSMQLGQRGKTISGKAAARRAETKVKLAAKRIQDAIFKQLDKNWKAKQKLFEANPNARVNFSELYKDTINRLDNMIENEALPIDEAEKIKAVLQAKFYKQLPKKVKGAQKTKIKDVIDPKSGEIVSRTRATTERELGEGFQPTQITRKEGIAITEKPLGDPQKVVTTIDEATDMAREGVLRGEMTLDEAAKFVKGYQTAAFEKRIADPTKARILRETAGKASDLIEQQVPETAALNRQSSKLYLHFEQLDF